MGKIFKEWLPTIVAAILVVTNVMVGARWTARIEERLAHVEEHAKSEAVHMPLEQKLNLFITRREADKADNNLANAIRDMSEKIDYLYRTAKGSE